jgi:hypothetical protein
VNWSLVTGHCIADIELKRRPARRHHRELCARDGHRAVGIIDVDRSRAGGDDIPAGLGDGGDIRGLGTLGAGTGEEGEQNKAKSFTAHDGFLYKAVSFSHKSMKIKT